MTVDEGVDEPRAPADQAAAPRQPATLSGRLGSWALDHAHLLGLSLMVVVVAVSLHRRGIGWGDDWSLYLRQGESLYEGNIGQVIGDNHFNVDNAARPAFSPYVYPWGFPILMAPMLRLFGHDWAMLKMVGVVALVVFVWAFHAVVRARLDRWVAFAVVAVIATSMPYLGHTGFILSELPYMASAAIALWYLDRVRRNGPLHVAPRGELITLGLLAVWVFNIRREGLAMIAAIVAAGAFDLWPERRAVRAINWRRAFTPLVTFVVGVIGFQLLLPSALVPQYEDAGLHQTWRKFTGVWRTDFGMQLDFPFTEHADLRAALLWIVFTLAMVGIVVRLWRAPRADIPVVVFAVGSLLIVGMIPAVSQRYLLTVTPFAVYFATQAIASIPLPKRAGAWIAIALLSLLTVNHLTKFPSEIDAAREFNDAGRVQDGPDAPNVEPAFDAVRKYTHQDDVVAFFKVRLLTYLTGRRGIQASDTPSVLYERSDFYLMRRQGQGSRPQISDDEGAAMGWEIVWEDAEWVLWRLPGTMGDG